MSKLYVGVTINQKVHEPDFPISLPDEEEELIVAMYNRALEKSGTDEETFGPKYYQQLKKEDKDLADMLESAVYSKLYTLLWTKSINECVQAMRKVDKKDRHGNYYQDFAFGNRIDIDMTDFPRIL